MPSKFLNGARIIKRFTTLAKSLGPAGSWTEYKLFTCNVTDRYILVKDLNVTRVPQSTMNRVVKDYIRTGRLGWILPQLAQVDND